MTNAAAGIVGVKVGDDCEDPDEFLMLAVAVQAVPEYEHLFAEAERSAERSAALQFAKLRGDARTSLPCSRP